MEKDKLINIKASEKRNANDLSCWWLPTQSLYSLMNHILTIDNSYILCAITLHSDIIIHKLSDCGC